MRDNEGSRRGNRWIALGLFLFVLGFYLLSSPGRIDIVDGQIRFDVTQSWISTGLPQLRDPALRNYGIAGRGDRLFAFYNAGPSVAAAPLVWLGRIRETDLGELQRFLFSLTSSFFGAGAVVLIYVWLRGLGCSERRAGTFALISAFATYNWPLSATTFDQAQQTFFLTAALYCAWKAGRDDSLRLSAWAGTAFGWLINYQENFALLWPAILMLTLRGQPLVLPRARLRVYIQLLPTLAGIALLFAFNNLRFEVPYLVNRVPAGIAHPPGLGNPLVGLPSLLLSPGKGVFFYSPVLILGLLGLSRLTAVDRWLTRATAVASVTQLAFISCLSFFGSDWAWGPRYLGPVLLLWVLPAALWVPRVRLTRRIRVAIVAAGLSVQLLALSVDNHRFFFEHRLRAYFWYTDPWFYFRHSALFERPGEIWRAVDEARTSEAKEFAPVPYRGLVTYMTIGNADRERAPEWMLGFRSFCLPRPWPLWMSAIDGRARPISLAAGISCCFALIGAGMAALVHGRRWLKKVPASRR